MAENENNRIERPPVVVIMGHIDHGKSTLLDYIRKSNVVEGEAGGITQHISSYEVTHEGSDGAKRKITFLDTPGHEAFGNMRSRGARVADVAILIVSAEDGVKAQTLEALNSIKEANVPFIVAINKIDKPGANVDMTKASLVENGIYIEGMGGDIPWAPISSKTGEGIPELLDLLLLAADIEELLADPTADGSGVVIESNVDTKKGVTATLIIKNGVLKSGMCIVVGDCIAPVRIMEDFHGSKIDEATFSSPVRIIGFNKVPEVGAPFSSFGNKKEAEKAAKEFAEQAKAKVKGSQKNGNDDESEDITVIPLIIKTDVLGTIEAIKHEIDKIEVPEHVEIRIVQEGAGSVSENDVKAAGDKNHAIIVGFNVTVDGVAKDLSERAGIEIQTFNIIYELAEWLKSAVVARTPKVETLEVTSRVKVLKQFSTTKNKQVLGGRIEDGTLKLGDKVRILKSDQEAGTGTVTNLQTVKEKVKEVSAPTEFGMEITADEDINPGHYLEGFVIEMK